MLKLDLGPATGWFTIAVLGLASALAAPGTTLAQERNPDRNAYFGE